MGLGAALGLGLNWAGVEGMVDASIVGNVATVGKEIGDLFLRLLQMLVVPLIVSSLITGVTGMGDLRTLGAIGGRAIGFYLTTSFVAIVTGIAVVNIIRPGEGAELAMLEEGAAAKPLLTDTPDSIAVVLWEQLESLIPKNPLAAATEGDMLPVIFFSLLIGVFIGIAEHREGSKDASIVRRFFSGLFDVMMQMTLFVVKFAPIGVFGFTLYAAAGKGPAAFRVLGWYVLTVFVALLIHAMVTLPFILRVRTGRSPLGYARQLLTALVTAFSTASSNGTLPLTMENVEKAGVRPQVASFVLPLGATINMDGTALYEAVAVLFIAQVYGIDLTMAQQGLIALTALLASIGAAGIPHAGMVMMVVVLNAVGLPTSAVALILAVDRILDMLRTTVNVWSDSIAAAVVDAGE
ncbi:MAG: dicarboxylate/amino acid:cation symporter [Deltaproteobacteria bacterium]|nr:dicarboxylate/amino acid:cation symporter [Deltaproteobacteria bacterium]NND28427.1 dicarboxylate/amino acid:cation symporter [Myxococcales bacterium]MBT8464164.1 dicarboxylate/amino acid:cation symporter [Deltaproteobacteria bacterium]MBT8483406.1 dicarboxylate/amino acid:cation symporter [Deltaproteobacteria bacterium]NNK08752.1 dicarboxylate/amino acid:cation symporter [Myxococcales bacterium]